MTQRFNKFGLRRDLNFLDLDDPTASLNNLLSGLVDIPGESFTSEDLDAIRDIRSSLVTNDAFRNIAASAFKVTDSAGNLQTYKPILKFKNRFDVAKFTIGAPNFYGGNGLTQRTYADTKINSTAALSSIFTGTPDATEIFWERGIFDYVSKLNTTLNNTYGGNEWNGYFRPTTNGSHTFTLSTTGFDTFEFDDGTGTLVLQHRKSQYEYSFEVAAASLGAGSLTLTTITNVDNLFVGDVLIHQTIAQFADPLGVGYTGTEVKITSINRTTGEIGLSSALAEAIGSPTNFTFRHKTGEVPGLFSITTQNLEAYRAYRIRIRFWIPNIAQFTSRARKTFNLSISAPTIPATQLNYKWLYDDSYNVNPTPGTVEFGNFRSFYTNRLELYGGTVGGSVYNEYQSLVTNSTLNFTYSAPTSLTAITKQTKTVSYSTSIINFVNISLTDNIEVGNYIFSSSAGITPGTRVKDIVINSGVFLTITPTVDATNATVIFVDHRGLITYSLAASHTSGTQTITGLSSTSDLAVGDVVVSAGSPIYNIITRIVNSTSVTTSKAFTSTLSGGRVFFYRNRGLRDTGLAAYCANVFSAPTVAQSNSGANTLTLAYVDNLVVGQKVQYGTRIPAGTTITNINTGTKVITLSANITDDIPTNQLITFVPSATPNAENKEICFPAIDTSPPFNATPLGLSTTSGRPIMNIAPTVAGSGVLKFVGLSANGVVVTTTTSSATFNRQLTIKDGAGNTYKILATT
jgi:hypothetical protein